MKVILSPPPLVTIIVVTFNHAKYIEQCLDGVLSQEVDFPFEILVCDDCSTDGTSDIVDTYEKLHSTIRVVRPDRNIGGNRVLTLGLSHANGTFLALIDGDDYWTDKSKLATQAGALLSNPEVAGHFTNAFVVEGDFLTDRLWAHGPARRYSITEIWQGNPFPTAGSMLRLTSLGRLPSEYVDLPIGDWPLYILCAISGSLEFDPRPMAAYRLHPGGVYSRLKEDAKLKKVDDFYRRMIVVLGGRHVDLARAGQSRLFLGWATAFSDAGEHNLAWQAWWRSRWGVGAPGAVSVISWMRRAVRLASRTLRLA